MAESRTQASRLIESGQVLVGGSVADRAARLVGPGEPVVLSGPPPRYVGRGGAKLEAALDRFGIDVAGRMALDAGASTGGFTDCLLQAGAARVVAVDVGRAQLHERLRADERVESLEQTDVRTYAATGRRFPVVVCDLSFISLRTVAGALVELTEPVGHLVALVKPQFEAGRGEVSQGRGIIRDPEIWARALEGVIAAMENAGATTMDLMVSPLRGAEGNVEFLAWFHRPGDLADAPDRDGPDPDRPHRLVGAAVAEAVTTFGSIGGGS